MMQEGEKQVGSLSGHLQPPAEGERTAGPRPPRGWPPGHSFTAVPPGLAASFDLSTIVLCITIPTADDSHR